MLLTERHTLSEMISVRRATQSGWTAVAAVSIKTEMKKASRLRDAFSPNRSSLTLFPIFSSSSGTLQARLNEEQEETPHQPFRSRRR